MNRLLRNVISISAVVAVFFGFVQKPEYVRASENRGGIIQDIGIDDKDEDSSINKDAANDTMKQNDITDDIVAWEKYGQTIYNTTNGLISNNVSSITQTSDGIVWIGTDKGLAAYDGNEFITYGSFYHFDGVNDMVRTKDGGVWFATTTYGGAVNLGSRFQHFDDVSESASNYATGIAEGNDGYIYIGTLENMLAINPQSGYVITQLTGDEYYYVTSVAAGNDTTAAVTINGDLVFVKDSEQVGKIKLPYRGKLELSYADGYFIVGTAEAELAVIDEKDIASGIKFTLNVPITGLDGEGSAINGLYYDAERLWILADDGMGYFVIGADGIEKLDRAAFYTCNFDAFESGFTDIMVDYQGNYWVSSSKRGVLLLRMSDFIDELAQTDLNVDGINSVLEDSNILYAATDSGMIAVDIDSRRIISDDFSEKFSTGRIVDITAYKGNRYAAVYGGGVYDEDGEKVVDAARVNRLETINEELYVLTDDGCTVWNGNAVTAVYGEAEGVYNTELTSAIYGRFGKRTQDRLFLGSSGAGIYVFEDGYISEIIDENAGLPSKQVNDMAAYSDGFFIATDNGVAYYNGNKILELEKMPEALKGQECQYIFVRDDKLYAVCRNALFVVSLDGLFENTVADEALSYDMYDEKAGFYGILTQGGHGFMDNSGKLYIPCGEKLYSYRLDKKGEFDLSALKLMIQSVIVDKRAAEIIDNGDNTYEVNLTKDAQEIDILCSVLNFSNEDPYVRYIMPGVDTEAVTVRLSELGHIVYEELEGGSHTFWFELLGNELDDDGNALAVQSIKLTINKEQSLIEKIWFRMILLAAAFGVLMYFSFKDRRKAAVSETNDKKQNKVDKTL